MWKKIVINKWDRYWRLTLTWKETFKKEWKRNDKVRVVECICDCWNVLWAELRSLRKWNTKSCWCLFLEIAREKWRKINLKHWLYIWKDRFSRIYQWMRRRCNNKNDISFPKYWWKWIKCERNNIENFYNDMYPSYIEHVKKYWEKETTLDRIDPTWNYCKNNCRRATYKEQANNTTRNVYINYRWKKYTLRQLSELSWIKMWTLKIRLLSRQDVERAVNEPLHKF